MTPAHTAIWLACAATAWVCAQPADHAPPTVELPLETERPPQAEPTDRAAGETRAPAAVPETSTLLLVASGAALVLAARRGRRRGPDDRQANTPESGRMPGRTTGDIPPRDLRATGLIHPR
jgi:hypothetical protein